MTGLSAEEITRVEKLFATGDIGQALITLVAEAFTAGRRAAEGTGRRVVHSPRALSAGQFQLVRTAFTEMGMTDDVLLQGARRLSKWAMDEYVAVALRLRPYKELVARTKPLNDSVVALMSFDPAALRRADEAVAVAAGAARRVALGDVADATRAAAATPQARAALAQIEFVLDAHHVVEAHWFAHFGSEFASLGWANADDMIAIAIPVDVHQRNLARMASRLGVQGGPSPSQVAGFKQVTTTLQRRLLLPEKFAKLSAADRASGSFHLIEPGRTTAKQLVEAHRAVYASEPGLAWLSELVGPTLVEIAAKLP